MVVGIEPPPTSRRLRPDSGSCLPGVELLTAAVNSGRPPGSGPLKRAVRKKLAGKGWPGREATTAVEAIEKRCLELFDRDYKYSIISNSSGEVCGHYPRQIVFLEYESTEVDRDRDRYVPSQRAASVSEAEGGSDNCSFSFFSGCEFFKDYKDNDYTAEGLVFNWNQVPVCFFVCLGNLNIDWTRYQSWDLVEQTQNYLKLLLHIINSDDDSGLLVHCISGWDRTPLFVSLLRLSLWADGAVHANLQPAEILYLTIAYDWFLFGHMLPDRLSKGEEIFFFCFNFLKHIVSEKFSAVRKQRRKNSHFKDSDFTVEDLCQLRSRDRGSITSLSSDFSLITEELAGASCPNAEPMDLFSGQPQASSGRKVHASSPPMVSWCKQNPLDEILSHPANEAKSSSSSSSNQSDHGVTRSGSSPLAVPTRGLAAEFSRSGSSLSTEYGSWQIVSGCGSIHDHGHFSQPMASVSSNSSAVTSAYDSPLPFSFQDEGPSGRMCSLPSERQARLEAVREIFLAAYSSTVGLRSSTPSPSGAISGLLEQFARGVGLRGSNAIV
ncbi:LOW QUALITY PROTEIN: myotubularin-related protein 14 [Gambusia affinis]|uniref:LOW QUALITY PROTEIN: myotubularin-related protein 14 n=1 Tax=Gambusia affinis TaxID=33528 RepID=UPI001CDBCDEB|nr:LOW QUALITY PROTEIN: myotubularin-related protein 14 [Gambusia affinis]